VIAEIKLNKPHQAQQAVLDSAARFRVMMCGRRFGKSLISQDISIDQGVEGKRIAYITPTYQLGKIFFTEILKLLPTEVYKKNEADLVINFITGGSIRFFTGERLDQLRGLKFHLVIIDEASYIPDLEDGWQNSIRPTLTDYQGKAIFLSTPKGKNYFYSLFLKGQNVEKDWESFKFTTYDNPHIQRSEIDDARNQLPPAVFEQEYMANPMENAANPFGSIHIRQNIYPISTAPVHCYGVDLAKSVDWTVITGLDKAGNVCYFERFQKDWKQTKDSILMLDRSKPILIDSTGVGDAIVEDLQRDLPYMEGFKFTSHSKQQLIEGLVQGVQQRKVTYPDGPIVSELEIFEYTFTSFGVRYSAPQGFHDDCVVSLALAYKALTKNTGVGSYSIV
jgi:hypothetical protein